MKRNIARTSVFVAALWLSLAAVALAQEEGGCTALAVAGTWGYNETGTLILPTGAVPYASVGKYTVDPAGNLSGTREASVGGKIQKAAVKGTATLTSDCTGTVTISFYDQSGNLLSTAAKALVYVDNATEAYGIVTSAALPNGTILPAVLTVTAKKLFPAK